MRTTPFENAARSANGHRKGACWVGRMFPGKGIGKAVQWARDNHTTLDFYGFGPSADLIAAPDHFMGVVRLEEIPAVLARYETFVFLPDAIEPFSRTTVEAWLAGLKLVVNKNVGAVHWIKNCPDEIGRAAQRKWDIILNGKAGP